MQMPGLSSPTSEADIAERANEQAESLFEKLKDAIRTDTRDIGVLRKELTITVPASIVSEHLDNNLSELGKDALIPGFRRGRAPRSLVQKKFGGDIRNSLKTTIVGQSFLAAVRKAEMEILGDPLFRVETKEGVKLLDLDAALEHLKLPDTGDFVYACEVEIRPRFELPPLEGIEVKNPHIEIDDANIDAEILRQRKIRGRYEPLEGEGAGGDADDMIVADVTLTCEGATVKTEDNLQLGVRPARLDGIPLMTLNETLRDARPGDERRATCVIPDDYERADLRGKNAEFTFKIHEVKRLRPLSIQALSESLGISSEAELREYVRDELEAERDRLIERAKKEQVYAYLLSHTNLDVPESLSARQTDRAVMRRVIELQQAGVPDSEIEARIDELRTQASAQVARDLRLEFILGKVAEKLQVSVTEEEVNTEIARMARLYNRRFDRVRDDLARRGLLMQMAELIRQDKCVARLLADAKLTDVSADSQKA